MTTNNLELSGKIALVTGGARGIGKACCLKLAEAGADVAINYRTSRDAANDVAETIIAGGRRACVVQADVSVPADVDRLAAEVTGELGRIDLLVNNAGVFDYVSHAETTLDVWQRALSQNLTSAYLVMWAVKQQMIDRKFGRIVNIASIAGLRPRPMSIAYSASKAGLISLTQSASEALAEHNIRVNAVAPGLVGTEILAGVDQESLDAIVNATPMSRIGEPTEIAELVLFLLSERSSYMTGQTLVASGGRVLLP